MVVGGGRPRRRRPPSALTLGGWASPQRGEPVTPLPVWASSVFSVRHLAISDLILRIYYADFPKYLNTRAINESQLKKLTNKISQIFRY